ncbi:hypothetical protein D3C87_2159380 [compost metagenome]
MHRRVEETVDDERASFLVHLILDGMAANGNLNDHVDIFWWILSDGNRVNAHGLLQGQLGRLPVG